MSESYRTAPTRASGRREPQLEHGFTRIAHGISEAIVASNLSARGVKVALFVMRKTYGAFGSPKMSRITTAEIAAHMRSTPRAAADTVRYLLRANVLVASGAGRARMIGIQKYADRWRDAEPVKKLLEEPAVAASVIPIDTARHTTTAGDCVPTPRRSIERHNPAPVANLRRPETPVMLPGRTDASRSSPTTPRGRAPLPAAGGLGAIAAVIRERCPTIYVGASINAARNLRRHLEDPKNDLREYLEPVARELVRIAATRDVPARYLLGACKPGVSRRLWIREIAHRWLADRANAAEAARRRERGDPPPRPVAATARPPAPAAPPTPGPSVNDLIAGLVGKMAAPAAPRSGCRLSDLEYNRRRSAVLARLGAHAGFNPSGGRVP